MPWMNADENDEGDPVVMHYLCANRDETVFGRLLAFDVRRDPNPHVGYGVPGPHYCLGAHLARRENKVMFRELFSRIGDIEATGEPELRATAPSTPSDGSATSMRRPASHPNSTTSPRSLFQLQQLTVAGRR